MSKSKPGAPANRRPEPSVGAHGVDVALQLLLQVLVLAAEIDEALGRADGECGDRHALEDADREGIQQHPVLEGSRLTLVGVADDVALRARRVAGAFQLSGGRETRAAAAAQVRPLHLVHHALPSTGDGGVEGDARLERRQQGLATTNVVVDLEERGRPFPERRADLDEFADLVDPPRRQPRNGEIVDQHRRALVAHPGAGGHVDAHRAISRDLSAPQLQALEHVVEQRRVAEHPVGDVV